jgi:hypothetical protein
VKTCSASDVLLLFLNKSFGGFLIMAREILADFLTDGRVDRWELGVAKGSARSLARDFNSNQRCGSCLGAAAGFAALSVLGVGAAGTAVAFGVKAALGAHAVHAVGAGLLAGTAGASKAGRAIEQRLSQHSRLNR